MLINLMAVIVVNLVVVFVMDKKITNFNDLEDFIQDMLKKHNEYKNSIISNYERCRNNIHSGEDKIIAFDQCVKSITDLIKPEIQSNSYPDWNWDENPCGKE